MSLTLTSTLSIAPVQTGSATEFDATARFAPSVNTSISWTDGTGADMANTLWCDQARSLPATTNDDLDLAGGLTDALGATVTNARIKLIYIKNNATTAGYFLEVGGAASNPISTIFAATNDILKIPPGGELWLKASDATGWAVTAGSADVLRIRNGNAATLTYDIMIVGANA